MDMSSLARAGASGLLGGIFGWPMDTAVNLGNLARAAYGYGGHELGLLGTDDLPATIDPRGVPGTSEYLAGLLGVGVSGPEQVAQFVGGLLSPGGGKNKIAPKPKRVRGPEASESKFVYHATSQDRLFDIADAGKLKTFRPNYGTDQSFWPDGTIERRAYFGPTVEHVLKFAPESGAPVVLRVPKTDAIVAEKGTGDLFARKPIAASNIEYLGDDDIWHKLNKLLE